MAGLERDDFKRRHRFCQIDIAHGARPKLGLGHSYSYGYRLASGTWARPKLGHSYRLASGTWARPKLGHSYRLASGTWAKPKAGAQLQVSIWDMGQG